MPSIGRWSESTLRCVPSGDGGKAADVYSFAMAMAPGKSGGRGRGSLMSFLANAKFVLGNATRELA